MKQVSYLDRIIDQKKKEVEKLIEMDKSHSYFLTEVLEKKHISLGLFSKALKQPGFAVIAEIKRTSPSKGILGDIPDPSLLALKYSEGGASAISVLTDVEHFGGSLEDLKQVSLKLQSKGIAVPTLRKDFIVHELQLFEAVLVGASAVLLIASVLGKDLKRMQELATSVGLEVLTEIHDERDLEIALEAGSKIIGVNNRNLKTFEINLKTSERLRPQIPKDVIAVSESGIHTVEQAVRMKRASFDAILVGEALVTSKDPSTLITKMKEGKNEN